MNVYEFALKMEKNGKDFYARLADGTPVTGLKTIFTMLSHEEEKHYHVVKELCEGGDPAMAESSVLDDAKNLFETMVAEKHFEKHGVTLQEKDLEGYLYGMKVEADSIRLYTDFAAKEKASGPKVVLLRIAEEEKKHYNILENIYEFVLKPQYFLQWREFTNSDEML